MKKINFYLSDFSMGGLENTLINVIESLDKEYDIKVYTLLKSRFVFDNQEAITKMTRKSGILNKVFGFLAYKFFKPRHADVHINWTHFNHYLSNICLKQKGKKIIWVHSNIEKAGSINCIKKCKMNEFDQVIAVSDESLNVIKKYGVSNSKRIYNLINKKFENVHQLDKKYDFINVARHDNFSKNIKRYVDIAKVNPGKSFIQIGHGKDYEENLKYSNSIGNIEFTGKAEAIDYMVYSDNFLLTSNFEGFGIVVLEALAIGCTPYTTNCVQDFRNGFWTQYVGFIDDENNLIRPTTNKKFNYNSYKDEVLNELRKVFSL